MVLTMAEAVHKARSLGINKTKVKKLELIREIQRMEGNFPCFGTAVDYCDQWRCCFRDDCLGKKRN